MHFYVPNFNIRIIEKFDNDILWSSQGDTKLDIKSDTGLFSLHPTVILADPFLFVYDDKLFLFYERQDKWWGKGRICMRQTSNLINWTDEVDVLVENFHLSFPFVFEDNGKVYMIPETGGDLTISLYEAEDSTLTKWKRVRVLKETNEPWYDSVVYKKEGKYYLFTGTDDDVIQKQYLFVSDSLFGPYFAHPCSPIHIGREGGRNAGSIIRIENGLFRPIQICLSSYGKQTSIMQIDKLTPTEYAEHLVEENIIDTNQEGYENGGHQFNVVDFRNRRIVATDARTFNYNIWINIYKLKQALLK